MRILHQRTGRIDQYLPKRTESDVYNNVFSEQAIREYALNAFGVKLASVSFSWLEQDGDLYIPIEFQYSSADVCELERVDVKGNTYYVYGTDTFGEWSELTMQPEYLASYFFEMILEKDEQSPFGFVLKSIIYEPVELAVENPDVADDVQSETGEESDIRVLVGKYKSNRGHTLEFFRDGTVLVSEGGGNTWCRYTIDAEGNIIISTDYETINATYDEENDKVTVYGTSYRRDY